MNISPQQRKFADKVVRKSRTNDLPTSIIYVKYTPGNSSQNTPDPGYADDPKSAEYTEDLKFATSDTSVSNDTSGGRTLHSEKGPKNVIWLCEYPFAIVFATRFCYTYFKVSFGIRYLWWEPDCCCPTDQNPWAAVKSKPFPVYPPVGLDTVYLEAIDIDNDRPDELVYTFLPLYAPDSAPPGGGIRPMANPNRRKHRLLRSVIRLPM
jgi:hypothetical protein